MKALMILFIILACIIAIIVWAVSKLKSLFVFGEEYDAVNTEDEVSHHYLN